MARRAYEIMPQKTAQADENVMSEREIQEMLSQHYSYRQFFAPYYPNGWCSAKYENRLEQSALFRK